MKTRIALYIILGLSAMVYACKKKSSTPSGTKAFTFHGIKVDHDTIAKGNVTNVHADVAGSVTYAWSASAGDIFNSGSTVLFGASTCCTGSHTVTCKVTDSNNNSESKSVVIQVN